MTHTRPCFVLVSAAVLVSCPGLRSDEAVVRGSSGTHRCLQQQRPSGVAPGGSSPLHYCCC
jgi:hypothetical protein